MNHWKEAAEKYVLDNRLWNEGMDGLILDEYAAVYQAGALRGYEDGLEDAAKRAEGAMYFDCLELTAWMGLPERKRKDWATRLAGGVADAIRALIKKEDAK